MKNELGQEFNKYATKHLGINSIYLDNSIKAMTPYIMEERSMNVAQIDVFSRLMMERIIWLWGPVEDYNSTVIQAQLMFLNSVDPKRDITIHVDSPGGSVKDGLKVIDVMDYISCDIATINTGQAASMGAVILGAGTPGKRASLRFSRTMVHQSSGGAVGNIQDARIVMKEWEKYNKLLLDLLAKYCEKKAEQIEKDSSRDNWLTSEETKKYGLIDKVIGLKK